MLMESLDFSSLF